MITNHLRNGSIWGRAEFYGSLRGRTVLAGWWGGNLGRLQKRGGFSGMVGIMHAVLERMAFQMEGTMVMEEEAKRK